VTLSRAIQALSLPLQHFYGLYKHLVVRSCQFFFQIYIFTAHIVQKHFLKAMRGLLEAMRVFLEAVIVLLEAVIVLLEAVRMFVKSVRAHVKAIRVLVEAIRVLV
jgi:hypothetical protein